MEPQDPPVSDTVDILLARQARQLRQNESLLESLIAGNRVLTKQLGEVSSQVISLSSQLERFNLVTLNAGPSPPAPPMVVLPIKAHSSDPSGANSLFNPPEPFHGEVGKCRGFVLQCRMIFQQFPYAFRQDASKIAYVVGLLRGRALVWAESAWSMSDSSWDTYDEFIRDFKAVFDFPDHAGNAGSRLMALRQGARSVADFSIDFRLLAAESGWNETALCTVFYGGLNDFLRGELAMKDKPSNLKELIGLAVKLENRIRERHQSKSFSITEFYQGPRCSPPVIRALPALPTKDKV